MMGESILEKHRRDVEAIQEAFSRMQNKETCSLRKSPRPSNVTRASHYKSQCFQLDINALNRVLVVDPIERVVLVEPRVTMQQLAKATLEYGMMVPVLPEFKGITVGGAIMGTGLESASHRFGLFSDQCLAYEVLLGNGTIIRATPQEHADLFYGIVGSYGSLGILLSVTLKLIPAQPWVQLKYRTFQSIKDTIYYFSHLQTAPDFLEGFVFAKDHIVVVEGSYLSLEASQSTDHTFSQKYFWSPWFYQHVKEKMRPEEIDEEKMPLSHYLFRHDRGAFWIGSYGTEWTALPRYFLESRWNLPTLARFLFQGTSQNGPKDPSPWYRFLLGWAMSSHRLYTWLHTHSEEWVRKRCIIQDFCIPLDQAVHFIEQVLDETQITPLWLCPISSSLTPQIFSPHWNSHAKMLLNVGVYGIPRSPQDATECVSQLEDWTKRAGGRKMLYSYSQYTPEQFWEIYPKHAYDRLRKTYHADVWTPIDEKVLMR